MASRTAPLRLGRFSSAASLRLCQRCHRSATCTACGAPMVAPSAKNGARSRHTTSIRGRWASHEARLDDTHGRAACRQAGRSRRPQGRSRSGGPCEWGSASTSRRTVLRLTATPKMLASRDPGRPAKARPMAARVERSRSVRWPCLRVRPGICSTNVRRSQPAVRQANRRTRSWSTTLRPALGTSAGNRR